MGQSKASKIIGWVAAGVLALLMLASGFGKITATDASPMAETFKTLGFWHLRVPLGVLEIVIAALLLIPRTSTGGLMLATGYWGGALATELTNGQPPVPSIAALALILVLSIFRNPEVLARFLGRPLPQ